MANGLARKAAVLGALALCSALLGCGGGDSTASTSSSSSSSSLPPKNEKSTSKVSEKTSNAGSEAESEVVIPDGPPPKKLEVRDLVKGTGAEAKVGDKITADYVSLEFETGKAFYFSHGPGGRPAVFTLGKGEVMEGWEQGIEGMKVGGRRQLIVPPSLGYGSEGVGSIPPNSTLVFVIELLAVK